MLKGSTVYNTEKYQSADCSDCSIQYRIAKTLVSLIFELVCVRYVNYDKDTKTVYVPGTSLTRLNKEKKIRLLHVDSLRSKNMVD